MTELGPGLEVHLVCVTPDCPANGVVCLAVIHPENVGPDGYAECHHCKQAPTLADPPPS